MPICYIQISIYQFVIRLIQIRYLQMCYIQFHVNLEMFGYEFVSKIQIVVYQFVCKTTTEKVLKYAKKGSPLTPRYVGICLISTKEYGVHAKHIEK